MRSVPRSRPRTSRRRRRSRRERRGVSASPRRRSESLSAARGGTRCHRSRSRRRWRSEKSKKEIINVIMKACLSNQPKDSRPISLGWLYRLYRAGEKRTRRKQFAQISLVVLRVLPERAQTAVKCSPVARVTNKPAHSRTQSQIQISLSFKTGVITHARGDISSTCKANENGVLCPTRLPCPSPSIHPSVKEYLRLCACEHRNPYPPYVGRMRITLTCILPRPLGSKKRISFLTATP